MSILFLLLLLPSVVSSSYYEDQCSSIVQQPVEDVKHLPFDPLLLQYGYARARNRSSGQWSEEAELEFRVSYVSETSSDGVLHVKAILHFQLQEDHRLLKSRFGYWKFQLDGYWARTDGKLCMTGSRVRASSKQGNINTNTTSVLVLDLSRNSTAINSLTKGTFKLINVNDNLFDEISILGYNQNGYSYTLISRANDSCSGTIVGKKPLSLGQTQRVCSVLGAFRTAFELEYASTCGSSGCNPFGKDFNFLPQFFSIKMRRCSQDGKLRMLITFSNSTMHATFVPNKTFVAEGFWDGERNQICAVACRILNSTLLLSKSYVDDCNVGMSLKFPASLSIKGRSVITGEIWSIKRKDDAGYFNPISFRSVFNDVNIPGLKYEYSHKNMQCNLRDGKNSKKRYPDPVSTHNDMKFSASFTSNGYGFFRPLFVGNMNQADFSSFIARKPNPRQKLWNVSYEIGFYVVPDNLLQKLAYSPGSLRTRTISAEGIYSLDTGSLCMMGCIYLYQNLKNLSENIERHDCNISIHVQFPPLSNKPSNASRLSGSIKSTREQNDSLYFHPLEFSHYILYAQQSKEEIKRMDFEIVMVLASLSLSCIFIAWQTYYVKRHPEVLSSASLLMLAIIALGLMIRLILNFEALFSKGHDEAKDILFISGGWREANEVVVRFIAMVAFLLQCWLLQRTALAKLTEKSWVISEGRVLKYCISLYSIGILIAWLIHTRPLWECLQSYAGLVLDGFLLPQILLNLFTNTEQKSLCVPFYAGMTLVRALPHLYDIYRGQDFYLPWLDHSRIYASSDGDFYSAVWDIIIPCAGIVLVILVFVQQRFGGSAIVPARFRRFAGYEQVSAAEPEVQMN